jgi:hypothetical protein
LALKSLFLVRYQSIRGSRMKLVVGTTSALLISALVLVMYSTSFGAGFFAEDYKALDLLIRSTPSEYLTFFFNPSLPAGWYRPLQGVQYGVEYLLFGTFAPPYHIVQVLLHLGNCLFLFGLVRYVTKKLWVGLTVAAIYAGLPQVSPGVFWVAVSDPQVSFFYLLAIVFWIRYLSSQRIVYYVLAVLAFVLTLLSKELGVTLPVAFLLVDRWLVGKLISPSRIVRRYVPLFLVLLPYIWYFVQRGRGYLSGQYAGPYAGLGVGPHILSNLLYYLTNLAFPWGAEGWTALAALAAVLLCLIYLIFIRRDRGVAFIGSMALLTVLPVLPLPFNGSRYLYLPVMASAILFALLLDQLSRVLIRFRWVPLATTVLVGLILVADAASVAEAADGFVAFARQSRTPVRSILQQHAAFAPDTYLYFINNSIPTGFLSGMFAVRYGSNAIVKGTDIPETAELHKHQSAYVYYFEDQNRAAEHMVEQVPAVSVGPPLPVEFSMPIRLEGYEVVRSNLKRGDAVIVLLYWKAKARIDKSYTVFVHLVSSRGETIAGADNVPRGGQSPTNIWNPNSLIVDWSVIMIGADVPAGTYRLEIGLYDAATSERLLLVDDRGAPYADKVVIEPFRVE